MDRRNGPVIQAYRSEEEIVRGLHCQSEPVFSAVIYPSSAIVQEKDTAIQGRVNSIMRREQLFRRVTNMSQT